MRSPERDIDKVTRSAAAQVFYLGTVVSALTIGALQMFHVRAGWLTNYGADVFGTAWLYAMFRQGRTVFGSGQMSASGAAGFVFLGCALSEFAQRTAWFPGTFDPLDLVAFAVTCVACYALDRRVGLG